jgi:hypothetical protein
MEDTVTQSNDAATSRTAGQALIEYSGKHKGEAVALPELVDTIARHAHTNVHVAKRAIFRAIDVGSMRFTPDFKIRIGDVHK